MVIYKVSGSLSKDGFKHKVCPIEVSESKACYISFAKKRVNKSKLMQIDSLFRDRHNVMHVYTYCVEEMQQKALDMLKAEIISRITRFRAEVDEVMKHVNV